MTKKIENNNNTTAEKTAENTLSASSIGVSEETVNEIKDWFTITRAEQCSTALNKWLEIGDICARIKAGKFKGTLPELAKEVIGIDLSRDEIQYSMLLHNNEDAVLKWAKECPSYKYNPRTLWTAYQSHVNPRPKKEKGAPNGGKKNSDEKELRKERKGIDAINAFIEYRHIRNKAGEDGNLLLGDLETLKKELENELKEICEAIELEAPAVEAGKAEKKAGKAKKKAA